MRDFVILFIHLTVTVVRLVLPEGSVSVVAESVLVRHQNGARQKRARSDNRNHQVTSPTGNFENPVVRVVQFRDPSKT